MDSPDQSEAIERLRAARGFLFDLDGTLVLGDKHNKGLRVLPGVHELLQLLKARRIPVAALTNGTVRTPAAYETKLSAAGIDIPASNIMTPSSVAAQYFVRLGMRRILVLGVEGVWRPFQDAGLDVILPSVGEADPTTADAVFVGWYRHIHMDEVEAACNAVWAGAGLFAASLVPFFATQHGRALGSSRVICAMITSVTDEHPTVLGKPSVEALKNAGRILDLETSEIAVVGDDPHLEIPMAHAGGALAIAVFTGISGQEDFEALPEGQRPHLAFPGVADLYDAMRSDAAPSGRFLE
jgi:4-nitrophenyl phosphatase